MKPCGGVVGIGSANPIGLLINLHGTFLARSGVDVGQLRKQGGSLVYQC